MNFKNYDSKWQSWGEMTLNIKRKKDGDSKCLYEYAQRLWMPKLKKDGGIECLNEYAERLWMLKLKKNGGIECLNGYENDYERQN